MYVYMYVYISMDGRMMGVVMEYDDVWLVIRARLKAVTPLFIIQVTWMATHHVTDFVSWFWLDSFFSSPPISNPKLSRITDIGSPICAEIVPLTP